MSSLAWFAAIVAVVVCVACAAKPADRVRCCDRPEHNNPVSGDVVYCAVRRR